MTQRKNASKGKRKQPLVSIIIPVYNAEKTIGRCLDSLINQTIADQIEIIAIDDGSTDGSLEILQSYESKNIKIVHIDNLPIGQVRNIVMEMASGQYIGFIDSDDYVTNEWGHNIKESVNHDEYPAMIAFRYFTQKSIQQIESQFNQKRIAGHKQIDNTTHQDQYDLIWGLSICLCPAILF